MKIYLRATHDEILNQMSGILRKSGIPFLGDIPWGSHLCNIHHSDEQLPDIIVPYMLAGLENNEYCIWVTAGNLGAEQSAKKAVQKRASLKKFLKSKQLQILPYEAAYDGRTHEFWLSKLREAYKKGYDGIRISGSGSMDNGGKLKSMSFYELEFDSYARHYNIIALCNYRLDLCGEGAIEALLKSHDLIISSDSMRAEKIGEIRSGRSRIAKDSYQEMLRGMAADAFLTQEKERRELASYLHDHVAQLIALAKITTGQLKEALSSTIYEDQLNTLSDTINQALTAIRSLTVDLSPPDLYELGLTSALERLCDEFNEKYGIRISFECSAPPSLPMQNETKTMLYRTVKEMLINAVKHSAAQLLTVSMVIDNGSLMFTVTDDGKGFNPDKTVKNGKDSFGLFNIRERLNHMGGSLEVKSKKGFGARIAITIPISSS